MLTAATRCYLIQMLGLALTYTNGCSCWSPDEENSPSVFPYHGCALPTELGGQVTVLQLDSDIVSTTPMKRPINGVRISIQRRRATGSLVHQPSQRPPHQLTLRRPRPRSRCFTPPASRPDRAATQTFWLGNPMAPARECECWTQTSHQPLQAPQRGRTPLDSPARHGQLRPRPGRCSCRAGSSSATAAHDHCGPTTPRSGRGATNPRRGPASNFSLTAGRQALGVCQRSLDRQVVRPCRDCTCRSKLQREGETTSRGGGRDGCEVAAAH